MARVDVLLPVYDGGPGLCEALASLEQQTHRDFRCFVLDDGSRDGAVDLAEDRLGSDRRFRFVRLPHRGIAATLQHGLGQVDSDLVARMDADDWCEPLRFERQLEYALENPGVSAFDARVRLGRTSATRDGMVRYVDWVNGLAGSGRIHASILEESPLVHPAVMMRTADVLAVGGYIDDGFAEDYGLWLRLVAGGYRLGKMPETLFTWNDPPGRLTRTHEVYGADRMVELKARFVPLLFPQCVSGCLVWGTGPVARRLVPLLDRVGVSVEGFVDVVQRQGGFQILGRPVIHYTTLERGSVPPLLIALGRPEAKAEVAAWLVAHGNEAMRGHCFVA